MNYHIVERESFQIVGIKRECPCGSGEGGIPGIQEFWGEATTNGTVNKLIPLLKGQIKGLLGVTDNYNKEKNTIDYWIAAEHNGEVPAGFSSLTLPPAKWVVFEVRGPMPTAIIGTWKQIYSEWFPSNGYESADVPALEAYIDDDLTKADYHAEIWLAIKY